MVIHVLFLCFEYPGCYPFYRESEGKGGTMVKWLIFLFFVATVFSIRITCHKDPIEAALEKLERGVIDEDVVEHILRILESEDGDVAPVEGEESLYPNR
jgi:hypothetical protein